jgi:hypothetical protein
VCYMVPKRQSLSVIYGGFSKSNLPFFSKFAKEGYVLLRLHIVLQFSYPRIKVE